MLNYRDYLNFAEKYIFKIEQSNSDDSSDTNWLLIPATILAWTAIESFVNNRLYDYGNLPEQLFQLHERAFLLEKKIKFIDSGERLGEFILEGKEYRRLEDKIFFLISKFSLKNGENIKGNSLWQNFQNLKELRDNILHPRIDKEFELNIEKVKSHIKTAKEIIQLVSEYIWGKKVEF